MEWLHDDILSFLARIIRQKIVCNLLDKKKQVLMNVINILVHVFVKTKIMNLLALMRKNLGIKNSKLLHLLFVSYACVFR